MAWKYRVLLFVTLFTLVTFADHVFPTSAQPDLPYLTLSRPDRGKPLSMAWSPDGRYIAIGTEQGLWVYTDTFADIAHQPDQPIHALAWSPDGKTLAAGYFGKQAAPTDSVDKFRPDSIILGGGIRLWTVHESGRAVAFAAGPRLLENGSVYALEFSPDGRRLASLSQATIRYFDQPAGYNDLRVFDLNKDRPARETLVIPGKTWQVQGLTNPHERGGVAWSHNGRYLAVGMAGVGQRHRFPLIWDTIQFKFIPDESETSYSASAGDAGSVSWSQDDSRLAVSFLQAPFQDTTGGLSVGIVADRYTEMAYPELAEPMPEEYPSGNVYSAAWRPQSNWLAYARYTVISLWDRTTNRIVAQLDTAFDDITMLEWSPDGSKLLSAGLDYHVRLWKRFETYQSPDPQPIRAERYPHHNGTPSPDGQWLAYTDKDRKQIHVAHLKTGVIRQTLTPILGVDERVSTLYWSPDRQYLAALGGTSDVICTGLDEDSLYVWSLETGGLVFRRDGVTDIAWRPDSVALALGLNAAPKDLGVYTTFEIRAVGTWEILQPPPPDEVWASELTKKYGFDRHNNFWPSQWSPDGRLLAFDSRLDCGIRAGTSVILWDTKVHRIAATFPSDGNAFGGWSPDSTIVAVRGNYYNRSGFHRLKWEGDRLTTSRIESPCSFFWEPVAFSPDGRYALCDRTVIDTQTGWPVFRFRRRMDFTAYRWEAETLTAYDFRGWDDYADIVTYRPRDFLPQVGR